jgi:hypothetical protein
MYPKDIGYVLVTLRSRDRFWCPDYRHGLHGGGSRPGNQLRSQP